MAGLGEACSHASSLLFYIEAFSRAKEAKSCTQEECKWLLPKAVKEVPYLPVENIDFRGATRKMKALHCGNMDEDSNKPVKKKKTGETQDLNRDQRQKEFLKQISLCGTRPAILAITEPYSESYVPFNSIKNLFFPDLYSPAHAGCSFEIILKKCDEVALPVLSPEQLQSIQCRTSKQSHSKLWYRLRSGRITASKFKQACRTDVSNPSMSLLKSICYPADIKFSNDAVSWGLEKESTAVAAYMEKIQESHKEFKFSKVGLMLNNQWPFLGASPDGLISCQCCGQGILEVKCPYSCRDIPLHEYACKRESMLVPAQSTYSLKKDHQYYYQVQCQLFISGAKYAHFVVWTPQEIHMETILPDKPFFASNASKAENFFKLCILPEMLGKYFTRQ